MDEIARFLAAHPPFATLPGEVLERTAAVAEVERFPRGTRIFRRGGEPSVHLYVLASGRVELQQADGAGLGELVEALAEGDVFGQLSLLSRSPPLWDAVALTDAVCYLIPAGQVERLRREPGFEALLIHQAGDRIRKTIAVRRAGATSSPFLGRAGELATRPLVTCGPRDTVREAAGRMHAEGVSSLVVLGEPLGFLTDRDLRDRVVATGLALDTPVAALMSTPLVTTTADSTVGQVLLTMVDRGIHHLPVSEAGRLVGMISDTDLLRHESRHPLFLRRRLAQAGDAAGLAAYTAEVRTAAARLVDAGTPVDDIGRIVASAHDALLIRVLRDAEARLGPPPPYAFLVLGSQARMEATLHTDQDHALVLADDAGADAQTYLAALAEELVAVLERCGFPRCPGGVMATNPDWRVPLGTWQRYFHAWVEDPEHTALADAIVFFDFRQLHGTLDAEAPLRPIVRAAAGNRVFLARLARMALRRESPLDFLGHLRGMRRRGHRHELDLKLRGIAGIVDLGRLFALEAGIPETNTLARLHLAGERGTAPPGAAADLAAAFEYLQEIRLRHQAAQLRAGQVPDNFVALSSLTALERRWLRDLFRLLGICQESVRLHLQADLA